MHISIEDLTVKYGDTVAVDDLSLQINSGELLVLLGPSGCGKTTTMRSVAGLEEPSLGRIVIGDEPVFDSASKVNVPANRRNIGMVFQSYAIWPHKTVAQNVQFPLKMQGMPAEKAMVKVNETLELVGLGGLGSRGASQLSGGQMQRVALARSVAMEPRVLLLDEPLSNLDARLRDLLRFELRQMQQELGLTTIYVTHDQSEALALADRIAVMRDGVIVQLEDPISLYKRPRSVFVADFLGVANLWEATSDVGSREARIDGGDTVLSLAEEPGADGFHVCMRPEVVSISRAGQSPPHSQNAWVGRVRVASFLGTHLRYRVELHDGTQVDVVNHEIGDPLHVGEEALLSVAPEDILVLEDRDERIGEQVHA